TILTTRRSAREDDWANVGGPIAKFVLDEMGVRSSVGSPIVVKGQVWGALFVHSKQPRRPLPPNTESRLANFSELVATAISNAQARSDVRRLADEQAALRRVATLVAEAVSPNELFAAATEEVGKLLGGDLSGMIRYNDDGTVSPVAVWAAAGELPPLPSTRPTEEGDLAVMVAEAGGPVRVDDWERVPGPTMILFRELGIRSSVASP